MKKELKDYLHLYLGCDVYMDNPHAAFHKDTLDVDLLERLYNDLPMKCYKLILRPLSDMTEDEEKYVGLGLKAGTANASMLKSGYFHSTTPKVFYYLLSKHFDLFGLIESGLAVNAAEIKSVSSR